MLARLKALLKKEFIQMRRDRLTFAIMIMIPIIQLTIFGYAINTEVKHLPTALYDLSKSMQSNAFVQELEASGYYRLTREVNSIEAIHESIRKGESKVGLVFPPDFVKKLNRGEEAKVAVIVDASDSMSAGSAISTAQMMALIQTMKMRAAAGGAQPTLSVYVNPLYNPDFISSHYTVPGILGIILTITMMMITAISIVREKEFGTLEQLLVTPLRPLELMVGKIIPYVVIGFFQITFALGLGIILFDVPVHGDLVLLYLLSTLFVLVSLSAGILISTMAKNQLQAIQISFFLILPSILLSGFMFPREAMPKLFYWLSDLIPLTYFLEIIRGILLKGVGIEYLYYPTFILMLMVVIMLSLSLIAFHRRVISE